MTDNDNGDMKIRYDVVRFNIHCIIYNISFYNIKKKIRGITSWNGPYMRWPVSDKQINMIYSLSKT